MEKVLLVRMDKIGDLVLALPADQSEGLRGRRVTWAVAKGCGFIVRNSLPKREHFEVQKAWSLGQFRQFIKTVKKLNPDIAIVLHAPWWVGLALWRAGVPRRFARRSQWHSWLFYNSGLRQSRKSGDRHEADLNAELVNAAFSLPAPHPEPLQLTPPSMTVEQWGLKAKDYIVVHPGMAGSALNISIERWSDIVSALLPFRMVAITGTKLDRAYTDPLFQKHGHESRLCWLNEKLNSEELLSVLASARAVVAPSTGVLHLAASLGTPVVGVFSPVPVQRPTRWGPRGPHVVTLVPTATPEEIADNPANCMDRILATDVTKALHSSGALP